MPLTPFISSIMELTMTRVCIMTQKSLKLFGKNKKNEKKHVFSGVACFVVSSRSFAVAVEGHLPASGRAKLLY